MGRTAAINAAECSGSSILCRGSVFDVSSIKSINHKTLEKEGVNPGLVQSVPMYKQRDITI